MSLKRLKNKKLIKQKETKYSLDYLAISKNHIVTCGQNSNAIYVYDYNLTLVKTIVSDTIPAGLAYSPNQKYLITGSISALSYEPVNIYDVEKNYKKVTTFTKHNNSVASVNFLDNNTAISAGGEESTIYIWKIVENNKFTNRIQIKLDINTSKKNEEKSTKA